MGFDINPNAQVINPIFSPIDEMDPRLLVRLGAASLSGYSEGEVITSVTAGGNGAARLRTFDAASTGWQLPLYTEDQGRPAMLFDGARQIKNFADNASIVGVASPLTLFWTFNLPTYTEQQSVARAARQSG